LEGERQLAQRIRARLTPAEGRKFALTLGAALAALAALLWWRDRLLAGGAVGAAGALLILAGLAVPARLGSVYHGWMGFAALISRITTPVLMGIIYFGLFVPSGILMRLLGRNPLRRQPENDSYLVTRPSDARQSDIKRQF
jgi:hypothetical protein